MTDSDYSVSLVSTEGISGIEVAMHVLAQTTRFVIRKQLTPEEAAKIAIEITKAFMKEVGEAPEASGE